MAYRIKETNEFSKKFNKLPNNIKLRFEKQFKKIKKRPYNLGKPLGYKWLRELKNKKFRIYYVIYESNIIILLVGLSTKKDQQEKINIIKKFKNFRK